MTSRRRTATALTGALVALVALAGCGVPRDQAPRAVPAGQVDPRLLAEPSPTGTPEPTGSSAFDVAFVIGDDSLRLIRRSVSPAPADQQVTQLLVALAAGPDDADHAQGLSTALPSDVTLKLEGLVDGEAVVEINGGTKDADPRRLPLSVAQVVLTVTSHPDVHAVRIVSDGQPVEPPLPDGNIVHRALTARDYASLVAPGATPSPSRPA
jgi:spore germination protein GerM